MFLLDMPQSANLEATMRDDAAATHIAFPILEYDEEREAVLEPQRLIHEEDVPRHAVICFFQDVISRLTQQHGAHVVKHLRSDLGTHPFYELCAERKGRAVVHPGD